MRYFLLPLLLAAPLAACVNFGAKPPEKLLSLTSQAQLQAGAARTAQTGRSLIVAFPQTSRLLDTNRIPVQTDDVSFAYVKGGQWADQPGRLFQHLLAETLAAKTDRMILDPAQFSGEPGTRLEGELLQFAIDARTRQAVVTYDATLLDAGGTQVTKRRFSATQPVGAIKAEEAGRALNEAANAVATQVAAWIAER